MSSRCMIKSTIVLLAVALTSMVAADHLDQLKSICADKKVDLTKASDLSNLLKAAESNPDGAVCSQRIRLALIQLDHLVNSHEDNLCSAAHIEQIRAFYNKYVGKLPRALKAFFLSYGFGVSRVCKTNLISSLLTDGQAMLDPADLEQISAFTSDDGPIGKIVKEPKDVDDIVLPGELGASLIKKSSTNVDDSGEQEVKSAVVLPSKGAQKAKKIQSLCATKFEPIYSQLVLPVLSLSRIGLNYKGEDISSQLEQFQSNKKIYQWYRIVYLCELVRLVEVFEAPESDDKKKVRVLTSEEAEEMRKSQPAGQILGDKIDFQLPTGPKLDDLIVDKQDTSMRKLISKFDDHKTEQRRLRSKIVGQTVSIMKQLVKQSNLNLVGSFLKRGSVYDQLDKIATDYINQLPEQENTPTGGLVRKKRDEHQSGDSKPDKWSPEVVNRSVGWGIFFGIIFVVIMIICHG